MGKVTTLGAVWMMLHACAPSWEKRETKDHVMITFGGRNYAFPTGKHGRKTSATEVETGHGRTMARHFGIYECAKQHGF